MAESLTGRVEQALGAAGWAVTRDPAYDGGLHLAPAAGEGAWPVAAIVDDDAALAVFYSLLPDDVPAERRGPVLQVLNLANLDLDSGCFDLDPDDGEVRLRTAVELGRAQVDDEALAALLEAVVTRNLDTMGEWVERIEAVAGGAPLEGDEAV